MKRTVGLTVGISACLLALLLPLGQQAMAQAAGEFEITLEDMGYKDRVAYGPKSTVSSYFSVPPAWEILEGSYVVLNLDYSVLLSEGIAYPPALVEVVFNNQTLHTEELYTPTSWQLFVSLPSDLFRLSEDPHTNAMEILFTEYSDCELDLLTTLTVKGTSAVHLVYRERSLPVDLALLPKPIYQRMALEPTHVRFVLPDEPGEADTRAATIAAARFGQLTGHALPISATVASEYLASSAIQPEHLVVLGTPDENPMIGYLELPVSLAERRLALRSQMPMTVSYGSVFSYTLFVENTTPDPQSLIVEDRVSPVGEFLECEGPCEQVAPGRIRWNVGQLAPGQSESTTITLRVTPVVRLDEVQRHTATLFDSEGRVLNVDTLVSQLGEEPDSRLVTSPVQKTTRFFVQGSQAVPEDAGVIQEIVSPWSTRHVAVIVTGLDDAALLKAAQGLNPRNRFPGVAGEVAIVEDVRSPDLAVSAPLQDISFASLGYRDVELSVLDLEDQAYSFEFPPGATLGGDAYLALHLAHAAVVSKVGGGVKVTLNGVPVGSAALDDSNLDDAWLKIPLSSTAIRPGSNYVRIYSTVESMDRCLVDLNNAYWLEIYANSFLHLGYRPAQTRFDLAQFPYPFNRPGHMGDVLFALSDVPAFTDIEGLLRIASLLGSGSSSEYLVPQVAFGGNFDLPSSLDCHVLAIGLPTMNPAIRSANAHLPQPFVPDGNDIYQSIDGPVYGILPGTDLGFVQELDSPWDGEGDHVFVAVTGTTEEGVRWAASALSQASSGLKGDFALVRSDGIDGTDTRPVIAADVVSITVALASTTDEPSGQPAVETPTPRGELGQPSETPTPHQVSEQAGQGVAPTSERTSSADTGPKRPIWLWPLLILSVLTVVGAVVWAVRRARL